MGFPVELRPILAGLPSEAQINVTRDYERRRKSKTFAYLAWFFLGWHYLYLRRVGLQIAFWLTIGGLGVWWLVDLFRVGPIVNRMNEDTARDLLMQYKALSASSTPQVHQVFVDRPAIESHREDRYVEHRVVSEAAPAPRRTGLIAGSVVLAGLVGGTLIYNAAPTSASSTSSALTFVTKRSVNFRGGPSTDDAIVGSAGSGEYVKGRVEIGPNGRSRWVKVEGGSHAGQYVSYLNLKPIEQ